MQFEYDNKGVCSVKTIVELDENNIIQSVQVLGGCNGNLKGISALLKGQKAEDVIERMEGITCGGKRSSCPDQIAQALKAAIAANH
jgi:uncharacterized protein (TIGR03905 family)